jgi:hypothetical protein
MVIEEGVSGGGGGECPQMASLISSISLGVELLAMTERTHKNKSDPANKYESCEYKNGNGGGIGNEDDGMLVVNILRDVLSGGFE